MTMQLRAAVPAARDAAMDSIIVPICNRLLIERVRGRRDPKRDR
jgi:hypothetical protein